MDKDEALRMALKSLQKADKINGHPNNQKIIVAIEKALAEPKPVQVSPLDFVTMTLEKEHLVGRPVIWAQWPNEEKNT